MLTGIAGSGTHFGSIMDHDQTGREWIEMTKQDSRQMTYLGKGLRDMIGKKCEETNWPLGGRVKRLPIQVIDQARLPQ